MAKQTHRGRLQAQGGGLEESESWAQEEPLTKRQGLSLLRRLRDRLRPGERELRGKPFEEAERFIEQTEGGVDAPVRHSFRNRKTRDVRVDIEVWGGTAFICITLIITILLWLLI